jgi:hypothetical protein
VRRSFRILAAVSCFLLWAVFVWLLGRNSPSRDALFKYKAELQAKGEKLTFDELTKSRSVSTNASYQTITNLGRKLGSPALSPNLITLRRYVAPGSAQAAWKSSVSGAETNGLPPLWEQFATQLSEAEPALTEMRLALKDPASDAGPWPKTNTWTSRYDFVAVRQAAYWFSAAALSELRQGKREAALQEIEALAGLARLDRDEYTLVAQVSSINDDELLHLQLSQESLEAVRLVQQHRPWPEIQQRLAPLLARLNQLGSWPESFRYRITAITMPNFPRALDIAIRTETERQLTTTAIALRRYQLRHGTSPQMLDELIPDFLAALPADPMSGKQLLYRPDNAGGFVLYSVGLDGKDDGGDPAPAAGNTPGLWEGRDAVWPSAAP